MRSNDRMNDKMQRQSLAIDLHRDRVQEERHVFLDHFDGRMGGFPSVFLTLRIVNAHLGSAGLEGPYEVQVCQRSAAEVGNSTLGEVFRVHLAVILANERSGLNDVLPPFGLELPHYFFVY